jgi:hypothetical protein
MVLWQGNFPEIRSKVQVVENTAGTLRFELLPQKTGRFVSRVRNMATSKNSAGRQNVPEYLLASPPGA